jgi:hypothetical protein
MPGQGGGTAAISHAGLRPARPVARVAAGPAKTTAQLQGALILMATAPGAVSWARPPRDALFRGVVLGA